MCFFINCNITFGFEFSPFILQNDDVKTRLARTGKLFYILKQKTHIEFPKENNQVLQV